MTDNVPLLPTNNLRSGVQFGARKEFHTVSKQQSLDSAFLGNERRPWKQTQTKPKRDVNKERDLVLALLSTTSHGLDTKENVEKIMEENISFRDLASLCDEDLQLFGFDSRQQRGDLVKLFSTLPNQDPSYEHICRTDTAQGYNNLIVGNAANHLMYMRSSLAATNYKLQVMPPEDVVVGDKRYASRFALEALNSVQSISDELVNDLKKLEKMMAEPSKKKHLDSGSPAKEKKLRILYYTAIAVGTACAWFWWWSKYNNSANLENISVKI
ncbi:uncharacterized protein LOC108603140 isoform X1 [Drosophila busckii]|uniref:uncharacterized protein LOC108603140 isoform X1 n=1 Tax=Drosophila busckii TaxID=30019 RepID=UPI001432AA7D|nr:uncharacterized protein LOC108603140 isoform X1 [Drosophila busckii]